MDNLWRKNVKISISLAIIWFLFACMFSTLSIYHLIESGKSISPPKLEFKKPPVGKISGVPTGISGIKKFAEDMKLPMPAKPGAKPKKKRKKTPDKGSAEDGIKIKQLRRIPQARMVDEISEYDEE